MAINLEHARQYAYDKYLSKSYTNPSFRANWEYKAKGQTIPRPNHGLAHSLRAEKYVRAAIQYYQKNAKDKSAFKFSEDEIQKMELAMIFSVVGRENDAGWADDYVTYRQFKQSGADRFEAYCRENKIFKSEAELQKYKYNLLNMGHENNPPALRVILDTCHKIDLSRCFYPKKVQTSIIDYINRSSAQPNNADIKSLLVFAQDCMKATGNRIQTPIRTDVKGIRFGKSQPYNPDLFIQASQDPKRCRAQLAKVNAPTFDNDSPLALIKQCKGMIRLMNANPSQDDIGFNFDQLVDPMHIRPIRGDAKSLGDRSLYRDQKTGKLIKRGNKIPVDIKNQKPITTNPPASAYKDRNGNPIPRAVALNDNDRGKPKNTIFTKKLSYSLIRPDGKIKHFQGTGDARKSFLPIGILCDVDQMHTKGERYIWKYNVLSKDKFWVGKGAVDPKNINGTVPGLRNRGKGVSLAELQAHVTQQASKKLPPTPFNEVLMGGSKQSLKAIFATEDSLLHRINLINSHLRIKQDYKLDLPMMIVDGTKEPKMYTKQAMETDLKAIFEKERAGLVTDKLEKDVLASLKQRLPSVKKPLNQEQFVELMKSIRLKRGRLNGLLNKPSLTSEEQKNLTELTEELCADKKGKVNLKMLLNKKGYSKQLDNINFGVEKLTSIPSSGDGTSVLRGSSILLKNVDYSGLEFNNCNFSNVDLSNSNFSDSRFMDCKWKEASLRSCQFDNALFRMNHFEDVDFSHSKIENSAFSMGTKHSRSTFFDVSLKNVRNFDTHYQGSNFIRAKLDEFKGGKNLKLVDCVIPESAKKAFTDAGKVVDSGKPKVGILWRQNLIGHTGYKMYQDIIARGGVPVKIDYDPNQTDFDMKELSSEVKSVLQTKTDKPIPQAVIQAKKPNIQAVSRLASEYANKIDGLVIVGGLDLEPEFYTKNYDATKNPLHSKIDAEPVPLRSLLEFGLINEFAHTGKPLFGICRGSQVVNAYYGGTIDQDLASTHDLQIRGIQDKIKMTSDSKGGLINGVANGSTQKAYACHHQAVKKLGEGLFVVGESNGLPYALENQHGSPIILTQFHPEVCRDPKLRPEITSINDALLEVFADCVKDSQIKHKLNHKLHATIKALAKVKAVQAGDACIKPSALKKLPGVTKAPTVTLPVPPVPVPARLPDLVTAPTPAATLEQNWKLAPGPAFLKALDQFKQLNGGQKPALSDMADWGRAARLHGPQLNLFRCMARAA